MDNKALIEQILTRLRPLDVSLATRVYKGSALAPRPSLDELMHPAARLFWLTAFTSYAQSQSHSGLSLDENMSINDSLSLTDSPLSGGEMKLLDLLGTGDDLLRDFPGQVVQATKETESPRAFFVYRSDARLIYLHRWYKIEADLGALLRDRLERPSIELPRNFGPTFARFFKASEIEENPWQAAACVAALRHDFLVVTGGPGTGKTTTITRLIGLLLSLPENQMPRKIKMIAPTGKAAERMKEAFAKNLDHMLERLPVKESLSLRKFCDERIDTPSTVHSCLGFRGRGGFAHHEGNLLNCDVLIVDEATMVDLDLFFTLFKALSKTCRIVLLGDKNQLAAVETGNVFSDLTSSANGTAGGLNASTNEFARIFKELSTISLPQQNQEHPPLCGDQVVELVKSYRFGEKSSVAQAARLLINESRLPERGECSLSAISLEENWREPLEKTVAGYRTYLWAGAPPEALIGYMSVSRILCAVRQGEHGVHAINRFLCEYVLGETAAPGHPRHGLPFMILRNDKTLNVWNGDCGVFFKDKEGTLGAYFPAAPGEKTLRRFNPYALPEWEAAFAVTIHKSQGSEYESVVIVLPEMKRPFINWELVYTAITRAKRNVVLILPEVLIGSRLRRARRISGLRFELGKPEALGSR